MNLTKINLKNDIKLIKHGKQENTYWVPRESDLWEVLYSYYVDMPDTSLVNEVKHKHDNYVVQFNLIAKHRINGFSGKYINAYDSMGMSTDADMIKAVKHEGFCFQSSPAGVMHTLMPDEHLYRRAVGYAYAHWIL